MLETIMKLAGTNFKRKTFPASGNHFLWFFCQQKQFFRIVETYFSANDSFRVVETIFFLRIWDTPATASFIFLSSGNVFLNAFQLVEKNFLASKNAFFIYFLRILLAIAFSRLVEK